MKKLLFVLVSFLLLSGHYFPAAAQDAPTKEEIIAGAQISRNIVMLMEAMGKNFIPVKGELLTKTRDSTVVFSVNGMGTMKAADQYIMVRSTGKSYYMANYADDEKALNISFTAFTEGIKRVTNADGSYIVAQDKEHSSPERQVYMLSRNGVKVGSYTMDVTKKEGTLIIGLL